MNGRPLRVALPKGRLLDQALEAVKTAGISKVSFETAKPN